MEFFLVNFISIDISKCMTSKQFTNQRCVNFSYVD